MALNLNKCFVAGRLCADPELKQTTNGISVCTFRVAVNRKRGKESEGTHPESDFFTVNAWRDMGDFVARYFRKGSPIFVMGSIRNRSFTTQDGQKRNVTEIIADSVEFVESAKTDPTAEDIKPVQTQPVGQAANFAEVPTDEDLPF